MNEKLGERAAINDGCCHEAEQNRIAALYPGLLKYCRFLSQNKWDGDDIAQEAILKAIQHYKHTQHISAALLNKIAYNNWMDTLRKRKNESLEDIPEMIQMGDENKLTDVMEAIQYLLTHFTPKQAVIYILKEAFQYRAHEIADILETTEIAVKSVLHRIKTRLGNEKLRKPALVLETYWAAQDRIQLSDLFYDALMAQDPTSLIQALPKIQSLKTDAASPKLTTAINRSYTRNAPYNALCMAA
jgi:RNA polymerase sigma factor (sigma-70 family)